MRRRTVSFFIIIMLGFTSTGCWGQREVSELGIVQVTGVDREPDGKYRVTILTVIPIGGGSTEAPGRSNVWVGSAVGTSISDAFRNLRSIASKRLVWIDNKMIVIGEEMAKHGINEIMDYSMRNRELRYRKHVLVSEGKALDVLSIPSDIEENLPLELKGIVENTDEWMGAYVPDLRDFLIGYLDRRVEAVAGKLTYYETDIDTFSTAKENYNLTETKDNKERKTAKIGGSAVFKGDKLAGWLNAEETRGYRWIIGEVDSGSITTKKNHQSISIEIRNIDSRIEAKVDADKILFSINLKVRGDIIEYIGVNNVLDENVVQNIEESFEDLFIEVMKKTVTKAQKEYSSDFLGFGRTLYRKYPDVWREIEEDWDILFPQVTVKYTVNVTLDKMGERF